MILISVLSNEFYGQMPNWPTPDKEGYLSWLALIVYPWIDMDSHGYYFTIRVLTFCKAETTDISINIYCKVLTR